MSGRHALSGIPVDRDSTAVLVINDDGSLSVRTTLRGILPRDPTRIFIGNTAKLVLAANTERRAADVFNNSTDILYLGFANTITVLNGMVVLPYCSLTVRGYTGEVWGISSGVSSDIRVLEIESEA